MKMYRKTPPSQANRGSIIVTILVVMLFMTTVLFGLLVLSNANLNRARQRVLLLQAQYSAESGADAALATLNGGNSTFTGTSSDVTVVTATNYKSTYATSLSLSADGSTMTITATGKVYSPLSATSPTYTRKIRVTATRISGSSASSVMSRNILAIGSSVKNVIAKDVFLNGYIDIASNSTDFTAENITIAGKKTGSTNCSISGRGDLKAPSSFSNPAQTKVNVKLAYSNCVSLNPSSSSFNVSTNQTDISPIQSMYLPWSTYMDSSYQNSPTGCSDWTGSGSTITIPSTGNTKKTHYPDAGSGIASTCGSSGDITLKNGSTTTYNIADNVHIRANLCATNACEPKFNNTSGSIKYVFVEGDINFDSVNTASGSSPIVFVSYGIDPASHAGACPYGGSIYLGNGNSNTFAPAIYFLATNGICFYQTKFSNTPALGGVGGKNVYIATNSGSPFYLGLDPNFPVSSIPINLSWRATGYERL